MKESRLREIIREELRELKSNAPRKNTAGIPQTRVSKIIKADDSEIQLEANVSGDAAFRKHRGVILKALSKWKMIAKNTSNSEENFRVINAIEDILYNE